MSWDESWATAASLEENMGQDFNIQQPPQIVAQVRWRCPLWQRKREAPRLGELPVVGIVGLEARFGLKSTHECSGCSVEYYSRFCERE